MRSLKFLKSWCLELVSSGDIISFTIRKDGDKYQAVEFKLRKIS